MKKTYTSIFGWGGAKKILFALSALFILNEAPAQTDGSWAIEQPSSGTCLAVHENPYVRAGNKFYLIGGRGNALVQEYDPATKVWTNKASLPGQKKPHHFQAVELNGLIYVLGAFEGNFPVETPIPNVYVYNPIDNTWTIRDAIPQDRQRGGTGAVVYNNKIYLVGGITNGHTSGHVNWFDEYNPTAPAGQKWRTLPDAPHARDHFNAALVGDKLVVAAGRRSKVTATTPPQSDNSDNERLVDIYNFSTGSLTTPANSPIPTPRAGTPTAVLGNEVLVMGGESTQSAAHNNVEAFNVITERWSPLSPLAQGIHATAAVVLDNKIYIAAGSTMKGSATTNIQQVYTSTIAGVNEADLTQHFKVYPNPFNNTLSIKLDVEAGKGVKMKVYNVLGVQLKDVLVKGIQSEADLSDLPVGIYFVKFQSDKGTTETIRLVKQ